MKYVKAMFVTLFVMLLFILAIENFQDLTVPVKFRVNLLFVNYETSAMPLALVAIITFVIGVLSCGLYGVAEIFKLRGQIKTLMKEAREKDAELNSFRNLPVNTEDMGSDHVSD